MAFDLAELLNYESQMSRDANLSREDLAKRDRSLRQGQDRGSLSKSETLRQWLLERKKTDGPWPGQSLVKSYEAAQALFLLLGLLSGLAAVQGFLSYDGDQPVNIIPFIAFYGVLQILLILWFLLKSLVARAFGKLPGGALVYGLREFALRRLNRRPQLIARSGFEAKTLEAFLQRLKDLHAELLMSKAWLVFQIFGIGFHLASLATFVLMISFNDYTFAWRTTLSWDAGAFHAIVGYLAWPFAWISESLVPSLALIEASQFNRFQGQFSGGAEGGLSSAAWWPYLSFLMLGYGLLPRCLLALYLKIKATRYLKTWAFDDFQSESLWNRLQASHAEWTSTDLEKAKPVPDQDLARPRRSQLQDVVLVRWRDVGIPSELLKEYLKEQHGIVVAEEYDARGVAGDRERIVSLLKVDASLVIVSDPFELPGEAIDKIRQSLREESRQTLILFAPLELIEGRVVRAGDRKAWLHALKMYRDPYLGLLEDV